MRVRIINTNGRNMKPEITFIFPRNENFAGSFLSTPIPNEGGVTPSYPQPVIYDPPLSRWCLVVKVLSKVRKQKAESSPNIRFCPLFYISAKITSRFHRPLSELSFSWRSISLATRQHFHFYFSSKSIALRSVKR